MQIILSIYKCRGESQRMSIKSSLEIAQKLTQLYLTGFSLNSIYNSTYLKDTQEASSIRKPTEENNYYDEWLSFSAKELEVKLKSQEFTSLLSQYINSLVELRTILIELGYPVYYLESLFHFYMRSLLSFAPMTKVFHLAPFEVVSKKGKTRLLHYLNSPKDMSNNHTPLLILYAPINRFHILDISQDKSVVRKLMSEELDVYLLDWGYPSWEDSSLSLDDYINYVKDAVQSIKNIACVDKISMFGYCWGGIIALIYAARNNENLRSLTLMAAPIDTSKDNTIVANWARSIDADRIIHEFGYIDGLALDVIFIMRNPTKYLFDRYLKFFSKLHDEQYVNNFIVLQRWLSDTPPIPGSLYLKIINDCYKKNLLVTNTKQFDDDSIDLSKITVPLLTIVAEDDDLVSPESTLAVASYVSSKDKLSLTIPGDHISLCVSSMAHKKLWPEAAKWILSR